MNKAELTEKAKGLNIDVESIWTNKEIEAAIAEKENEVVITSKNIENPEVEGEKALEKPVEENEPNRVQEPNRSVIEDKKPDKAKKPKSKDNSVILKYVGESSSFQIGAYTFSEREPFVVVDKDFADSIDKDHPDLKPSSKKELEEFYAQ